MKTHFHFQVLLSIFLIIPTFIWAQDPKVEFKNQMDYLLQQVDKSKITSMKMRSITVGWLIPAAAYATYQEKFSPFP